MKPFIVSFTVILAACTDSVEPTVELTDPCTGAVVGSKDLETGTYQFDDSRLDGTDIDAVESPLEGVCEPSAATKQCWVMVEGPNLGCAGCCTNYGGGVYSCSEYCWDVSST